MEFSRNRRITGFTAVILLFLLLTAVFLAGCTPEKEAPEGAPRIRGLRYESTVELKYADQFSAYRYSGGYVYIDIAEGGSLLAVPEGGKVPEGLPEDTVVIQQPLTHIYMASTSTMALFDSMDALYAISFSGLKEDGWHVDNAKKAMQDGSIAFAGKYSAPDYEKLIDEGCQLAVESTMIYHKPEVKEKLEELGIKVMVERSSYEAHPLGRTEWIKLYGLLLGREKEAEAAFDIQAEKISGLEGAESTGRTVAFFYVNSTGNVVTYKPGGYVPAMIKIAGGDYALADLPVEDDSKLSTVNMSMEQFYDLAGDADILIYNSSIMQPLTTLQQFLDLSPVMADFKAFKENNVWCTEKSMFQETDKMGSIIEDIHNILISDGSGDAKMDFVYRLG